MVKRNLIRSIRLVLFVGVLCSSYLVAAADIDDPLTPKASAEKMHEERRKALKDFNLRFRGALDAIDARTNRKSSNVVVTGSPDKLSSFSPVRFEPFDGISLDLIRSDSAVSGSLGGNFAEIFRAFNIQVVTRDEHLDWPEKATMVYSLARDGQKLTFESKLRRDSDRKIVYVLEDPVGMLQSIQSGIAELDREQGLLDSRYLHPRPTLEISYLRGFSDVADQAFDRAYPVGTAITYSYRLGTTRLASASMFLGRPTELTSLYPQKEFLK